MVNRNYKKHIFLRAACLVLILAALTACGDGEEKVSPAQETVSDEKEDDYSGDYSDYGYTKAGEAPKGESPYYGIMQATITEVNGTSGDTVAVYSFRDEADPGNIWSLTGLEIGFIDTDTLPGEGVSIFFNGDIINDSAQVEFLVIAPRDSYSIERAAGRLTGNMMGSFTLETREGGLSFIKDNCRMDEGVFASENTGDVIVYYAKSKSANYPLRVFDGQGE